MILVEHIGMETCACNLFDRREMINEGVGVGHDEPRADLQRPAHMPIQDLVLSSPRLI